MNRSRHTCSVCLLLFLASGCALGTTGVQIGHSPFEASAVTARGLLAVAEFTDSRPPERREFIGAKRNVFGMVLGHIAAPEDETLEALLTRYFVEALEQTGFTVTLVSLHEIALLEEAPLLEGSIDQFWLDLYTATWHNIRVSLSLREPPKPELLWQRTIEGSETNILWLGLKSEFEKVIRQALDKALAGAIAEFESEEFASHFTVTQVEP